MILWARASQLREAPSVSRRVSLNEPTRRKRVGVWSTRGPRSRLLETASRETDCTRDSAGVQAKIGIARPQRSRAIGRTRCGFPRPERRPVRQLAGASEPKTARDTRCERQRRAPSVGERRVRCAGPPCYSGSGASKGRRPAVSSSLSSSRSRSKLCTLTPSRRIGRWPASVFSSSLMARAATSAASLP